MRVTAIGLAALVTLCACDFGRFQFTGRLDASSRDGSDADGAAVDDVDVFVMDGTDVDAPADVVPDGCAAGLMLCGTVCADVTRDLNHCGACGTVCSPGQTCSAGMCACAGFGTLICAGRCVHIATDQNNCGGCANPCTLGASCAAGSCTCPTGTTLCSGGCYDTRHASDHCGSACGGLCGSVGGAPPTCLPDDAGVGMCATACPTPANIVCSGRCTDPATDNGNCGACGNLCSGGSHCIAGTCTCPTGRMNCGTAGAVYCVDPSSDSFNCGGCGTRCAPGTYCSSGLCT